MNEKNASAGVLSEQPLFRLTLALLPALAVANTLLNGVAIGVVTLLTLVCAGIVMALLGRLLPERGHIAAWLIVSCAFASAAWMLLRTYFSAQHQSLGIYVPLVTLIAAVLGKADRPEGEKFLRSVGKHLLAGVLFLLAAACIGALRELLGSGALLGEPVFGSDFEPMLLLKLAPGGFLLLGMLAGISNHCMASRKGGKPKGGKA